MGGNLAPQASKMTNESKAQPIIIVIYIPLCIIFDQFNELLKEAWCYMSCPSLAKFFPQPYPQNL
jgi:hypothetical protein